ncbi:hypothetical protein DL764_000760 [Monosporascus ibericus]|uniref:DUF221 domain-containing protein n=1 Tax=Monosporascus ibericus TaxID=155417 RepID=A0A4Q4TTY7_9PEZI|nr:hypothetical protein DL764_000760 [Monosporascus ibericus]
MDLEEDPNQGSAREEEADVSLSGLVATLIPTAAVAAILLILFLILRKSHRRYYSPRTYLVNDLHPYQVSLDAYFFLRFLRMLVVMAFVGCCILWPILFPVNATGGGGQTQLSILSYSNVDNTNEKNRYYAHALGAWVFYGFVMYLILRESIYYVNLRQAFLLSPFYANRISSRTVLFVSVPEQYLDEARLRKAFGDSVKNVWITGDTENIDDLIKERDQVAMKLEKAEVKLIKLANAERLKAIKKGGADEREEVPMDAEPGSLAARWIPNKKRPSHRLGFLGLVGKKVDTIEWCRTELARLVPATQTAQDTYRSGSYKKIPAVFIEFSTQAEAESAFQVLAHHQALQMSPKYIGVTPPEIVWSSLKVSWWQRVIRRFAVIAFITALIIFWAIPVGVVGIISNVNNLTGIFFLTWLNEIPPAIMGVVTGLLPSVLMAALMALVPIIMRSGEPSASRVELFTQNAYFCFQVVQVFLITTITSSASAVVMDILQDPTQVTSLLAENIPKASNFYIAYFLLQGLTIAAAVISQIAGFVIFNIMYKFLSNTPRAMYTKWANLSAISWGSVLPIYTNIAVISLVYATIAPLVLGFGFIGLSMFYLAWRYNVLFVTDSAVDTRGLIYPKALKQLFVGIYISEVCLIGLFAASTAFGPMALMIAFLVFTALFNITVNSAIDPLLYNLPRTLAAEEDSRRQQGSAEGPGKNGQGNEKMSSAGTAAEGKEPGLISKFLKPWSYCDFSTLRRLVPNDVVDVRNLYTDEIERDAYYPPSVTSGAPLLWIPQDPMGVSKQEVRDTGKVIPITDEGCTLDDKNKLTWDTETVRPPLWEEKIYY